MSFSSEPSRWATSSEAFEPLGDSLTSWLTKLEAGVENSGVEMLNGAVGRDRGAGSAGEAGGAREAALLKKEISERPVSEDGAPERAGDVP